MLPARRVHTTIPTQDIERLRRFYEDTLGFKPGAVRPAAVAYWAGDGSLFVLSRSGGKATGAHTQMAFTVPDVAAEVRELKAHGVVFEDYEIPKTVDSVAQMPAGRGAWFKDPDGNLIGLFEFADPI
jgi:catechol 2,3-dioxygenase-like lactoylglutathione lyase family enzyme